MRSIHYRFNHWIPKILGVTAITLYPFVLFADRSEQVTPSLMRHENMHIDQIYRVGVIRFYFSYVLYYFAGRVAGLDGYSAYARIPWEEEARLVE